MTIDESLVEVLQARQDSIRHEKPVSCYLSIYVCERCYGGPEEGGWWYDVMKLESTIYCDNWEQADRIVEESKEELERQNVQRRKDYTFAYDQLGDDSTSSYPEGYIPNGWSDGGEYRLITESILGSCDNSNAPRPHYE